MPDGLDSRLYEPLVRLALSEDVGTGDITTQATVDAVAEAHGRFLIKSRCVIAGLDVVREVFRQVDSGIAMTEAGLDGDRCDPGTVVAHVRGRAASLLTAERTALNFLQYLSGIATLTRAFVDAAGDGIAILDTRKTTPGFRGLAKYAVRCGGGINHRTGLYDGVLIKDNHIRLAGGIGPAVDRVRRRFPGLPVEVEAQTAGQVDEALAAGVDLIMLDNLDDERTRAAIARIGGRARVELSGNMTLDRVRRLAGCGADFISVGALTHSAPAADISLEIEAWLPEASSQR
jgi:nicotinate-nucleotide pyrophosphorylase (carboxylating)